MNMEYKDYIYKMDHYDAWNYIIIGPFSLLASFSYILLNVFFKEARQFPGNLLIIISIAEFCLCIHWIASGYFTRFISSSPDIDPDSAFCRVNSHIAFLAGSVECYFQLAFLISIIFQFKNTMRTIKFKSIFLIIPTVGVLISWLFVVQKNSLGLNIYGTCSVNQVGSSGIFFICFVSLYFILVIITLIVLRNFKKLSRDRITIRDDFYSFYVQYTILTFLMYFGVGSTFVIDKYILRGLEENDDKNVQRHYLRWFFISRLTNNIKIFIPFVTFLLRINDPFIKKLINKFMKRRKKKDESIMQIKEDDGIIIYEDDFLINNQIKQIRQGMARTMVKGLFDYFTALIFEYNKINDEDVINLLTHNIDSKNFSIEELDEETRRKSNISGEKYFDCQMNSLHTKKFQKIIQSGKFGKFSPSFAVNQNSAAIRGSGESDGGKGGEFFLITSDKRFVIKTINESEMKVFDEFIKEYSDYLFSNSDSFVARIIGLFDFNFSITSQNIKIIVMENVFREKPSLVTRQFDLKGSTFSRRVIKEKLDIEEKKKKLKKTMKDIDFNNIEKEIFLSTDDGMMIIGQLKKDVEFFSKNKIIDYSLLLGVIDLKNCDNLEDKAIIEKLEIDNHLFKDIEKNQAYMMGVIDYFQLYTYSKCMEKYTKKCLNCKYDLDTSSQPSGYYARRFMNYVKLIMKY